MFEKPKIKFELIITHNKNSMYWFIRNSNVCAAKTEV